MWHPDPDLLALAALPAEHRDAEVHRHLTGCALCHRHVESLRRTVDLALSGTGDLDGGVLDSPPPARIWRAITEELEIVPDSRIPTPIPAPARTARRRWRAVALPVAAAVVGVAAGVGIGIGILGTGSAGTPVARLAPLAGAEATGTGVVESVDRDGRRELVVRVDGLSGLAGGDYLEAWLMDASGTRLVSLGALTREGATSGEAFGGEFTLPSNLPMAEFGTVDVSAERWDGDPTHSRVSLLRGTLS